MSSTVRDSQHCFLRDLILEELEGRVLFEGGVENVSESHNEFLNQDSDAANCADSSSSLPVGPEATALTLSSANSLDSWIDYHEDGSWVYYETNLDSTGNGYTWSLSSYGEWHYTSQEKWGASNGMSYTCDSNGGWTYLAVNWDASGNGYAYYADSTGWWAYNAANHNGIGSGYDYDADAHGHWNYTWHEELSNGDQWTYCQDSNSWWAYSYHEAEGRTHETQAGTPLQEYYYDNNVYWLRSGDEWFYAASFQNQVDGWTMYSHGDVKLLVGPTQAGYTVQEYNACHEGWQSTPCMSLWFMDAQYGQYGFHLSSEFDQRLYDGIGWDNEPIDVSRTPHYSAGSSELDEMVTVTGRWTGAKLLTYYVENPSDHTNVDDSLNAIFVFSNDPRFSYLQGYIEPDWRVVYYDATKWNIDSWVYETQLLSFAEQDSPIDNLAVVQHGNKDFLPVGTTVLTHYNVSSYDSEFAELGEVVKSNTGDIQFWHCSVAGNEYGRELIRHVADYTGAVVWASTDDTTIVPLGYTGSGDYTLEYGYGHGREYGIYSTPDDFRSWTMTPWEESSLNPAYKDR